MEPAPEFAFAGDFSNAIDALAGIHDIRPDLVIMDVRMPGLNGIECTKKLKLAIPRLKVVIITGLHDADTVSLSLQAGADAYLTKPVSSRQCLATLRFAARGVVEKIQCLPKENSKNFPNLSISEHSLLSPREKEVLMYLAQGLLYKEISDKLGISYAMVHKYQHKIFQKLHISNRSEATRFWFENNFKS